MKQVSSQSENLGCVANTVSSLAWGSLVDQGMGQAVLTTSRAPRTTLRLTRPPGHPSARKKVAMSLGGPNHRGTYSGPRPQGLLQGLNSSLLIKTVQNAGTGRRRACTAINHLRSTDYLRTRGSWVQILPGAPIPSRGCSQVERPLSFWWGLFRISSQRPLHDPEEFHRKHRSFASGDAPYSTGIISIMYGALPWRPIPASTTRKQRLIFLT